MSDESLPPQFKALPVEKQRRVLDLMRRATPSQREEIKSSFAGAPLPPPTATDAHEVDTGRIRTPPATDPFPSLSGGTLLEAAGASQAQLEEAASGEGSVQRTGRTIASTTEQAFLGARDRSNKARDAIVDLPGNLLRRVEGADLQGALEDVGDVGAKSFNALDSARGAVFSPFIGAIEGATAGTPLSPLSDPSAGIVSPLGSGFQSAERDLQGLGLSQEGAEAVVGLASEAIPAAGALVSSGSLKGASRAARTAPDMIPGGANLSPTLQKFSPTVKRLQSQVDEGLITKGEMRRSLQIEGTLPPPVRGRQLQSQVERGLITPQEAKRSLEVEGLSTIDEAGRLQSQVNQGLITPQEAARSLDAGSHAPPAEIPKNFPQGVPEEVLLASLADGTELRLSGADPVPISEGVKRQVGRLKEGGKGAVEAFKNERYRRGVDFFKNLGEPGSLSRKAGEEISQRIENVGVRTKMMEGTDSLREQDFHVANPKSFRGKARRSARSVAEGMRDPDTGAFLVDGKGNRVFPDSKDLPPGTQELADYFRGESNRRGEIANQLGMGILDEKRRIELLGDKGGGGKLGKGGNLTSFERQIVDGWEADHPGFRAKLKGFTKRLRSEKDKTAKGKILKERDEFVRLLNWRRVPVSKPGDPTIVPQFLRREVLEDLAHPERGPPLREQMFARVGQDGAGDLAVILDQQGVAVGADIQAKYPGAAKALETVTSAKIEGVPSFITRPRRNLVKPEFLDPDLISVNQRANRAFRAAAAEQEFFRLQDRVAGRRDQGLAGKLLRGTGAGTDAEVQTLYRRLVGRRGSRGGKVTEASRGFNVKAGAINTLRLLAGTLNSVTLKQPTQSVGATTALSQAQGGAQGVSSLAGGAVRGLSSIPGGVAQGARKLVGGVPFSENLLQATGVDRAVARMQGKGARRAVETGAVRPDEMFRQLELDETATRRQGQNQIDAGLATMQTADSAIRVPTALGAEAGIPRMTKALNEGGPRAEGIMRFLLDQNFSPEEIVRLRNGDVDDFLTSKVMQRVTAFGNAEGGLINMPPVRVLELAQGQRSQAFQSFSQQAQRTLAFTVKEAKRGNLKPLGNFIATGTIFGAPIGVLLWRISGKGSPPPDVSSIWDGPGTEREKVLESFKVVAPWLVQNSETVGAGGEIGDTTRALASDAAQGVGGKPLVGREGKSATAFMGKRLTQDPLEGFVQELSTLAGNWLVNQDEEALVKGLQRLAPSIQQARNLAGLQDPEFLREQLREMLTRKGRARKGREKDVQRLVELLNAIERE